ncbi:MAG TPA: orotidine-5'-phosphate decarboxylase [Candidatus Omnitrophota bacterium]|nr:orotidine-5'-phosphate decarboxylase [Candidatus Omnitrophota bacterium]
MARDSNKKGKIILALDVADISSAGRLLDRTGNRLKIIKIGPALFTGYGPKVVEMVRRKGADVFLDLKFHDIPNTVASAVRQAVRLRVKMLTLHTSGGAEMLKAAAEAAGQEAARLKVKKPLLLGITVLTSDRGSVNTKATVISRARLAKNCGLDGIVCSAGEAAEVRRACGKEFVIVTPGIRPRGADAGDQKRVATAKAAFASGADYIVVGRPILEAQNPGAAIQNIIQECYNATGDRYGRPDQGIAR